MAPFGKFSKNTITLTGITVVELGQASNGDQVVDIVDAVVNVTLSKPLTFKADTKGVCSSVRASARASNNTSEKAFTSSPDGSKGTSDLIEKLNGL